MAADERPVASGQRRSASGQRAGPTLVLRGSPLVLRPGQTQRATDRPASKIIKLTCLLWRVPQTVVRGNGGLAAAAEEQKAGGLLGEIGPSWAEGNVVVVPLYLQLNY